MFCSIYNIDTLCIYIYMQYVYIYISMNNKYLATACLSERTVFFHIMGPLAVAALSYLTVVDFGQVIFSPLKFLGAKPFRK